MQMGGATGDAMGRGGAIGDVTRGGGAPADAMGNARAPDVMGMNEASDNISRRGGAAEAGRVDIVEMGGGFSDSVMGMSGGPDDGGGVGVMEEIDFSSSIG